MTENGTEQYFKTDRGHEFLDAAHRLRLYLQENLVTDSFAETYVGREAITADEFDEMVGVRMDNTGKVVGAFDIDLDKREFSAVNIMNGWETFAMGDVSTAAHHAFRKDCLSAEQKWAAFLDKLDGKQITSAGHLSARSFSLSDEIIDMDNGNSIFISTPTLMWTLCSEPMSAQMRMTTISISTQTTIWRHRRSVIRWTSFSGRTTDRQNSATR